MSMPHVGRSHCAVRLGVLEREGALPDVHAVLAAGLALVAPGIDLSLQPAAGAELPLGLGRQPQARPAAVGCGIVEGDVHDRVLLAPVEL